MENVTDTRVLGALDTLQRGVDQLRDALKYERRTAFPDLVSVKQAARLLHLHERTVLRHAQRGAGVKIGGAWRIDLDRLQAPRG